MKESVLLQCRNSISAEVSMEIKPIFDHSANQLICQFHNLLIQHKNVIDLGEFIEVFLPQVPEAVHVSYVSYILCHKT